jgi:hypothetical protein
MGSSYREALNNFEMMRARNLIADAKFAPVNLLESSEAGPHPPIDSLPLNSLRHGCIHSMRDLEEDQHQTIFISNRRQSIARFACIY